MCGIALIICGVRLEPSSLSFDSTKDGLKPEQLVLSIDDIKAAVSRRGPDSVGSKKLFLQPNSSYPYEKRKIVSILEGDDAVENIEYLGRLSSENVEAYNGQRDFVVESKSSALFHFIGATLQLRGAQEVVQPFLDGYKNILIYNGEIFGGLHVGGDENDGEVLMRTLENCCSCKSPLHKDECFCDRRGRVSIIDVLSNIKGPWAMIYWQDSTRTLWFGRDAFGRRSLLVHWPTMEDSRLLLSSVSPFPSVEQSSDFEDENSANLRFWEELPCGIYSITLDAQNHDGVLVGSLQRHGWSNHMLAELVKWERAQVEPSSEQLYRSQSNTFSEQHGMQSALLEALPIESGPIQTSVSLPALNVLDALRESVKRRSSSHSIFQATCHEEKELVPIAVLFSGGLDSMILAALLHECLDLRYEIDLLNVSFDSQSAPDRVTAKAGVTELRRIAPLRKWKLVEIDSHFSNLTCEMKHVMSLINPANTYMDLNIGIALWLASGGEGWLSEEHSNLYDGGYRCIKYKSKAKILLVGSGADEQCAGYGRHRTKYRNGRWLGLHEEMKLDMQRIWKRNLGRDDRCIADNGKEARFPFLDEDVIKVLLDIPLWEIADLNQPSGAGDKKILREVAGLLGLYEAAALPKRAIQFGSRIARESNRKNFGSSRAANQASAGSVVIDIKSGLS